VSRRPVLAVGVAAGFLAGAVAGARLGNRAWRATLAAARYRAQLEGELAEREAEFDAAGATVQDMAAELARERREYAALAVRGDELIDRCNELTAELAKAKRRTAELEEGTSVAFDVGLGVGRSASVAELLGGRWTRN
jgi:chromosome segregation ATPase